MKFEARFRISELSASADKPASALWEKAATTRGASK
jgi:hypothetical protein